MPHYRSNLFFQVIVLKVTVGKDVSPADRRGLLSATKDKWEMETSGTYQNSSWGEAGFAADFF